MRASADAGANLGGRRGRGGWGRTVLSFVFGVIVGKGERSCFSLEVRRREGWWRIRRIFDIRDEPSVPF